jgi:hypothetical protein
LTAITLKRESFASLAFLGRQQPIVAPLEVTLRDLAQRQMPDMHFGLGQAQAILHRSHYAARITPMTPPARPPLDCHVSPSVHSIARQYSETVISEKSRQDMPGSTATVI